MPQHLMRTSREKRASGARKYQPGRRLRLVDSLYGYAFVAPATLGFVTFVGIPLLGAFAYSFQSHNSISGERSFSGFENFKTLLTSEMFQTVLTNTAVFSVAVIPLNVAFGMLLALLMNQKIRGITFFRTAYFTPVVVSLVAWSLVWQFILQRRGILNETLALFNIDGPNWLNHPTGAMAAVIGVQVLKNVGISAVLLLAALQDIPAEVTEAAKLDGAKALRLFWAITRPLVSHTIFMVAILATINALKAFAQIYLLTRGGPGRATTVLGYYIYEQAFNAYNVGLASAAAVILFVIVLTLTLIQWWGRKRWVHADN